MGTIASLAQQMLCTPRYDLFAERDKGREQILQVHYLRTAAIQRNDVRPKGRLQWRIAVELIEDDLAHGIALKLDHHAIALAVRFIAQRGNAGDLLVAPQLADALDHRGLVHLVGNFGDDDRLAIAAQRLHLDLPAHDNRAAAQMVSQANALAAKNNAASREVRPGDDLNELIDPHCRIVDERNAAIDHFAEIVRRDVGGHPDRNPARAVY